MTHYYVAQWTGAGTRTEPFHPVCAAGDWSVVDLRPDVSVATGFCLIGQSVRNDQPGSVYLGADVLDAVMSAAHRNWAVNNLGVTLDAGTTYREGLFAILQAGDAPFEAAPTRWRRLLPTAGRWQMFLGGQTVVDLPVVAGGASFSDSFGRSNRSLAGDNGWLNPGRNTSFSISSNAVTNTDWSYHSQNRTPMSTDDHSAQCSVASIGARGWCGPYIRSQNAGAVCGMYYVVAMAAPTAGYALVKLDVNGVNPSTIASASEALATPPFTLYVEASGSSLTAKLNGSTKLGPSTDTTYPSGRYTGLYADWGDTPFNAVTLDDFAAADLTSSVTSISDDFNRADASSLGANWTEANGVDWDSANGSFSISGNRATQDVTTAQAGAFYNAYLSHPNHWAEVTLDNGAGTDYCNMAGPMVRCNGTAGALTAYGVYIDSSDQAVLWKSIAGTKSTIGTYPMGSNGGEFAYGGNTNSFTLRLEAVADGLYVFLNGILIIHKRDTYDFTNNTFCGMTGDPASGVYCDNFRAGLYVPDDSEVRSRAVITDSFTRGDTGSLGSNWQETKTANWPGSFQIVSNQATQDVSGLAMALWVGADARKLTKSQYAEVSVGSGAAFDGFGPVVRAGYQDIANAYGFSWAGDASGYWDLWRTNGPDGLRQSIGTGLGAPRYPIPGTTYRLRLEAWEVTGAVTPTLYLKGFVDDVLVAHGIAPDVPDYLAGTVVGITGESLTATIDNFEAGNLADNEGTWERAIRAQAPKWWVRFRDERSIGGDDIGGPDSILNWGTATNSFVSTNNGLMYRAPGLPGAADNQGVRPFNTATALFSLQMNSLKSIVTGGSHSWAWWMNGTLQQTEHVVRHANTSEYYRIEGGDGSFNPGLRVIYATVDDAANELSTGSMSADTAWHLWGVVYNSGGDTFTIYRDGVSLASAARAGSKPAALSLTLQGLTWASGIAVDEFCLFDSVLTAQNYIDLYNAGIGGYGNWREDVHGRGVLGRDRLASDASGPTDYVKAGAGVTTMDGAGASVKPWTKAGAATTTLNGAGAALRDRVDAGAGTTTLNGAGADSAGRVEGGAGVTTLNGAGADLRGRVDAGAGTTTLNGAGADLVTVTDAGAGITTLNAAGTDVAGRVEGGAGVTTMNAGGASVYTPGAVVYTKAGAGTTTLNAAGADLVAAADAGAGITTSNAGGADLVTYTETGGASTTLNGAAGDQTTIQKNGAATTTLNAAGASIWSISKAGAAATTMNGAGADLVTYTDAGAGLTTMNGAGADLVTYTETGGATSTSNGAGAKLRTSTQAGAGITTLNGAGADVTGRVDAGAGITTLNAAGADVVTYVETGGASTALNGAAGDQTTVQKNGAATATLNAAGATIWSISKPGAAATTMSAGGADLVTAVDAGAASTTMNGAGADLRGRVDAGAGVSTSNAAGADLVTAVDAGAGASTSNGAGADVITAVEGGAAVTTLNAGGASVYTPAAANVKAGAGVATLDAAGADLVTFVEAGGASGTLNGAGASIWSLSKAGAATTTMVAAGADVTGRVDAGAATTTLNGAGADLVTYTETGGATTALNGAAGDQTTIQKNGAATTTMNAAGADIAGRVDAGAGITTLNAAGASVYTPAAATVKEGGATATSNAAGADLVERFEGGAAATTLNAAGASIWSISKSGGATATLNAAGADQNNVVKTGSATFTSNGAGADITTRVEGGAGTTTSNGGGAKERSVYRVGGAVVTMNGAGAKLVARIEGGAAIVTLDASGSTIVTFTRAGAGVLSLVAGGAKVYVRRLTDDVNPYTVTVTETNIGVYMEPDASYYIEPTKVEAAPAFYEE